MQTRLSPSREFLANLARHANVQGYELLPKSELYETLKSQVNLDRVSRASRRSINKATSSASSSSSSSSSFSSSFGAAAAAFVDAPPADSRKRSSRSATAAAAAASVAAAASSDEHPPAKRQRQQLNKMDPIMLAPLPKKRHAVWRFERPGGSRVAFNVCTLADYLLATGDFLDPETRLPFSDDNLKEIDAAVAKTGCSKASVYAAAHTPNAFADLKFRRDALSGLERLAGEVVADILDVIENTEPHEAQMQLLMRELPLFGDYYSQLVQADAKYAAQCMSHWQQFISGPPNRPNADDYGLLECVRSFLATLGAEVNFLLLPHHGHGQLDEM